MQLGIQPGLVIEPSCTSEVLGAGLWLFSLSVSSRAQGRPLGGREEASGVCVCAPAWTQYYGYPGSLARPGCPTRLGEPGPHWPLGLARLEWQVGSLIQILFVLFLSYFPKMPVFPLFLLH